METTLDLDSKLAIVEATNPPRFKKAQLSDLMATPLAPSAVILHDTYIADVHYYYTLLDAHDQPRLLADLYKADNIRETGYEQLLGALSLTDISIAQQTLVSGDSLLPVEGIQRYRTSTDATEQKAYQDIATLLKSDSVLASNLVMYMLRTEVFQKCNFLTYDIALSFLEPRHSRVVQMTAGRSITVTRKKGRRRVENSQRVVGYRGDAFRAALFHKSLGWQINLYG
jgi:hypothetical protein